jgi:hypothetical protein
MHGLQVQLTVTAWRQMSVAAAPHELLLQGYLHKQASVQADQYVCVKLPS